MKKVNALKSHDIVVALKLISQANSDWRQIDIALELGISQGEVAKSLSRLGKSGLVMEKRVNRSALLEFLVHGLKYVYPADVGALTVGVPTAVSAPFFENKIMQTNGDTYVWASSNGNTRGQAIAPFYPGQAEAALKDKVFYELLSLIEVLRVGRSRERSIAEELIRKRFKSK